MTGPSPPVPGTLRYALAAAWTRLLMRPELLALFAVLAMVRDVEAAVLGRLAPDYPWWAALRIRLWGTSGTTREWDAPLFAVAFGAEGGWGNPAALVSASAVGALLVGGGWLLCVAVRWGRDHRRSSSLFQPVLAALGTLGVIAIAATVGWDAVHIAFGGFRPPPWWRDPLEVVSRVTASAGFGGLLVGAIVLVPARRCALDRGLLRVAFATAVAVALGEGALRVGMQLVPRPLWPYLWWQVSTASSLITAIVAPLLLAAAIRGDAIHQWMRAPARLLAFLTGSLLAHSVLDVGTALVPTAMDDVYSFLSQELEWELRVVPLAVRGVLAALHAAVTLGCALALASLVVPEPERAATP